MYNLILLWKTQPNSTAVKPLIFNYYLFVWIWRSGDNTRAKGSITGYNSMGVVLSNKSAAVQCLRSPCINFKFCHIFSIHTYFYLKNISCKYSLLHYWILNGLKTEMWKFSRCSICIEICKATWDISMIHTLKLDHFYIFLFAFEAKIYVWNAKLMGVDSYGREKKSGGLSHVKKMFLSLSITEKSFNGCHLIYYSIIRLCHQQWVLPSNSFCVRHCLCLWNWHIVATWIRCRHLIAVSLDYPNHKSESIHFRCNKVNSYIYLCLHYFLCSNIYNLCPEILLLGTKRWYFHNDLDKNKVRFHTINSINWEFAVLSHKTDSCLLLKLKRNKTCFWKERRINAITICSHTSD